VSVTEVGVAGWAPILTGSSWTVTGDGGRDQLHAADAERYRCASGISAASTGGVLVSRKQYTRIRYRRCFTDH